MFEPPVFWPIPGVEFIPAKGELFISVPDVMKTLGHCGVALTPVQLVSLIVGSVQCGWPDSPISKLEVRFE